MVIQYQQTKIAIKWHYRPSYILLLFPSSALRKQSLSFIICALSFFWSQTCERTEKFWEGKLNWKEMVSTMITSLPHLSLNCLVDSPILTSKTIHFHLSKPLRVPGSHRTRLTLFPKKVPRFVISINAQKDPVAKWPILERWDVPWEWQTASLTSLACGFRCAFKPVWVLPCFGFFLGLVSVFRWTWLPDSGRIVA